MTNGRQEDPIDLVSSSVWKGLGFGGLLLLLALPAVLVYELLPQEFQIFLTPKELLLIALLPVALISWSFDKLLRRRRAFGRNDQPDGANRRSGTNSNRLNG